jgi:hypothetical protein
MDYFDSPDMLRAVDALDRKDYCSALALLKPLADTGNPRAQCNLADLYFLGWGVEADGKKAVELYLKVAPICSGLPQLGNNLHWRSSGCRTQRREGGEIWMPS